MSIKAPQSVKNEGVGARKYKERFRSWDFKDKNHLTVHEFAETQLAA